MENKMFVTDVFLDKHSLDKCNLKKHSLKKHSQAVHIPASMRFDDDVRQVAIRQVAVSDLSPVNGLWDSFFMGKKADADFMAEHSLAPKSKRLSFD